MEKQTYQLSAEDYQKIVQSIILQIKHQEKSTGVAGMKKSSIIQWYIEALEESGQIEDEESLIRHKKITKRVIQRMIKQEHQLLEMRDTTMMGDAYDEEVDEDPVLVVHPAYDF